MQLRRKFVAAVAATVALVAAATATAAVTPPRNVTGAGKLVFCTDPGFPPMESLQGGKPVGADIEIGRAAASLMGVKAEWRNVGFDGIIAALVAKKCDAVITGMTDTAERRNEVDFTDYLNVGMSLMVKRGNPRHITGLGSLPGLRVAVQLGTTEKDTLTALNKRLAAQGQKPVVVRLFNKDSDAAAALVTGKVDAYFSDDPPIGYYVKQTGGKFEVAADKIQAAPYGIATRKDDALGPAMRKAIAQLYSTGTMNSILGDWGMSGLALEK
jgi:polar amino acid transport system substrate-binding protein